MDFTKKNNYIKQINLPIILLAIFWAFCLWLAYQIPYTHDDFVWGTSGGIKSFLSADQNSRFAGNLLVLILTRSNFLKTLVIGSVLAFIPALITIISASDKDKHRQPFEQIVIFLASAILLLKINKEIWVQTFGWVSGFANFSFSSWLFLFYFVIVFSLLKQKEYKKNTIPEIIAYFLFMLNLQLFIENLTVFLFVATTIMFFLSWRRLHRISEKSLALMSGAVVGLAIMFSSKIYEELLTYGKAIDGYRAIMIDSSQSLAEKIYTLSERMVVEILPKIFENNSLILMVIMLALLVLIIFGARSLPKFLYYGVILLHIFAVYCSFFATSGRIYYCSNNEFTIHLLINFGIIILVISEIVVVFYNKKQVMWELLIVWISSFAVMIPMVIVNENGARVFLTSNILLILFIAMLIDKTLSSLPTFSINIIGLTLALILAFVCYRWSIIYSAIGTVNYQRLKLIEEAKEENAQSISLPNYPYEDYLWFPYLRKETLKEFYGLPEEIEIYFEDVK